MFVFDLFVLCLQLFCLLLQHGGSDFFSPLEMFSVLIAGFCHDIRHPGLNNNYHVNLYIYRVFFFFIPML